MQGGAEDTDKSQGGAEGTDLGREVPKTPTKAGRCRRHRPTPRKSRQHNKDTPRRNQGPAGENSLHILIKGGVGEFSVDGVALLSLVFVCLFVLRFFFHEAWQGHVYVCN